MESPSKISDQSVGDRGVTTSWPQKELLALLSTDLQASFID